MVIYAPEGKMAGYNYVSENIEEVSSTDDIDGLLHEAGIMEWMKSKD